MVVLPSTCHQQKIQNALTECNLRRRRIKQAQGTSKISSSKAFKMCSSSTLGASAVLLALLVAHPERADGHVFQTKPVSRQFLHTSEFNSDKRYGEIEKHADAYNGGGPKVVKARYIERASDETKAKYGEGSVWPPAAAWDLGEVMSNGNYYESDEMAVSHGVCGDTPQSQDDKPYIYSTPNSGWEVLETYESGQIIEIELVVTNHHWGHFEFFLCDTADLDDPDGVAKQSCFNKYPLDRAEDDSFNSPVDPLYPGRYFLDPPCRGTGDPPEVDQTRPALEGVLMDGTVMRMRYKLPAITCTHCILMMRYHSGRGCRSPGYEEFNPANWPSACGPDKEDWIEVGSHKCNTPDREWGNNFWNCADIALTSPGESSPTPEPTPEPTAEPTAESTMPDSSTGDAEYIGCFKDDKEDRVMAHKIFDDENMSAAYCRDHCADKDALYYGTQWSIECWCGTSLVAADYERHGFTTCDMACPGNGEEACGGYDAFSLYKYDTSG